MDNYLYLSLNIFTILVPLIRSFEPRINMVSKWRFLLPAIGLTAAFFIIWDVIFTDMGVWGFNPRYLTGIELLNLPIEEWLFFITIPYACVFIYEVLNYFLNQDYLAKISLPFFWLLLLVSIVLAGANIDQWYTLTTFGFLAVHIALNLVVWKSPFMGRFLIAYLVAVLPFFLVNGILTGSFIEGEVVWYNNAENLGIRMFTIPFEDVFYGMLLILMNVTIYEYLKGRSKGTSQT